jgi:hypothetical protein
MSTFNGATFLCKIPDGMHPEWEPAPNLIERVIPYGAGLVNVQEMGKGQDRLVLPAKISDSASLALLRSAAGSATRRTLADYYGATYTGVQLWGMSNPRRVGSQNIWFCEMEFRRRAG